MALFSQRKGLKPLVKEIQIKGVDDDLRNKLWSALKILIFDRWRPTNMYRETSTDSKIVNTLLDKIWIQYFKWPVDVRPNLYDSGTDAYNTIRKYFYTCEWNEVYDLLEFVFNYIPRSWEESYRKLLNRFLEEEFSAYRLIEYEFVQITDEVEIDEIEEAITSHIKSSNSHLKEAMQKLSDRKKPDYRNSIKESISAVESVCRYIVGDDKATLGECLKIIKNTHQIHSAFESALNKLYGYSSDEGGIRHALSETSYEIDFNDAKFMLVSCSAFVNYLLGVKSKE